MISSILLSASSIGFSGSRSPSPAAASALRSLLPLVPPSASISVGCARGVDALVRSFFSSDRLSIFSVSSGQFGSGRAAFARRSAACVRSSGLLVCLPSSPACPVGVRPSSQFFGGGSGSWGSAAFALGLGLQVLLFLPSGHPPIWAGVSSSSVGGGWWLLSPAAVASQLCLF